MDMYVKLLSPETFYIQLKMQQISYSGRPAGRAYNCPANPLAGWVLLLRGGKDNEGKRGVGRRNVRKGAEGKNLPPLKLFFPAGYVTARTTSRRGRGALTSTSMTSAVTSLGR